MLTRVRIDVYAEAQREAWDELDHYEVVLLRDLLSDAPASEFPDPAEDGEHDRELRELVDLLNRDYAERDERGRPLSLRKVHEEAVRAHEDGGYVGRRVAEYDAA